MPEDTEDMTLDQRFAIGRVVMLTEIASGKRKAKEGEAADIGAAVIRYIKTGVSTASPEADALVRKLLSL